MHDQDDEVKDDNDRKMKTRYIIIEKTRETLDGELSSSADETRRLFGGTDLTLKQRIVFHCYFRDHQIVLAYTDERQTNLIHPK